MSWHPKLRDPVYVGPFVQWVLKRERLHGDADDPRVQVARDLGWPAESGVRRIYRHCGGEQIWAERSELTEALANAGVFDLYPEADRQLVERWCAHCKEQVTTGEDLVCPWCERATSTIPSGRKRGKPAGKWGKLNDAQLRALHVVYERDELSANALAKRVYKRLGFANHKTCAAAIGQGWKRLGLPRRERIAATVIASTKHGRAPRYGSRAGYKRWLLEQRGVARQPRCEGVKQQAPRKGQPCTRPAKHGSKFCPAHDPDCQLALQAHAAKMRKLAPRDEKLPMAPFSAWLRSLADEHGSLDRAALVLGLPRSAVFRYARGVGTNREPKLTITRKTVERWTARAETTLDAIYDTNLELAA